MLAHAIKPALVVFLFATLTSLLTSCSSSDSDNKNAEQLIQGLLLSGDVPIAAATVTVYSSSDGNGTEAQGAGSTDTAGAFEFSYTAPSDSSGVLREYDLGTSSLPMGVASDSPGNVWVSLSGEIDLPCPPPIDKPPSTYAGIAMVNLDGVQLNTRPTGPLLPDYSAPGGQCDGGVYRSGVAHQGPAHRPPAAALNRVDHRLAIPRMDKRTAHLRPGTFAQTAFQLL